MISVLGPDSVDVCKLRYSQLKQKHKLVCELFYAACPELPSYKDGRKHKRTPNDKNFEYGWTHSRIKQ